MLVMNGSESLFIYLFIYLFIFPFFSPAFLSESLLPQLGARRADLSITEGRRLKTSVVTRSRICRCGANKGAYWVLALRQKSLGNIDTNENVSSSTRVTHSLVLHFPKQGADTQYVTHVSLHSSGWCPRQWGGAWTITPTYHLVGGMHSGFIV